MKTCNYCQLLNDIKNIIIFYNLNKIIMVNKMENKSIWELTTKINKREKLTKDIECDILIVGAGMAGTLIGYFLSKQYKNVVLIDKDTIGNGVTKNTTAKITAQHGLIYNKLLRTMGYNKARLFYEANNEALNNFKKIINDNHIDCDLKEENAYVYTLRDTIKLEKEYKAYKKLNIKGNLTDKVNLPFDVKQALVMKEQASFHPLKFIKFISQNLTIYENTKMVKIDNGIVTTENGSKIKAKKIVIATHFPIIDNIGYYFIKQHQSKSYLIALKNAKSVNGMYIDENNKNGYTLRDYKDYVLFGGYAHKTGKKSDCYYLDKLEKESKLYFKDSEVVARFSAQDCMSLDHMPYIGKYSKKSNDIYVATGFNKWGMTGSMLSAMIITDLIYNKENKYTKLLSPSRLNFISSIPNLSKNSLQTVNGLLLKRVLMKRKDVINLEKNSSIIVKHKKRYLGIYKDNEGKIYAVDVRCPHLGCILSFNKEERAYECPCHGSKFDYAGNLIYSPSIYNTKKYKI